MTRFAAVFAARVAAVLVLLFAGVACSPTGRQNASGAGAGGLAGGAGGGAGVSDSDASPPVTTPRTLLLRDEAQSMVSYVEVGNPAAGWHVPVPYGRDLQLVGDGRFLIGTDSGYEERLLSTGAVVVQQAAFPGTLSAHRLRNGHTILAGVSWQGSSGVVLVEIDGDGAVQQRINLPAFAYVRLVRQTVTGTFLVTVDDAVVEADATGQILWRADVPRVNQTASHVWQALRVPSGETVVSTGFAASIQIFGADGALTRTITGPADVVPNQFVGFQILPDGNFVVANWQGHTGEAMGVQLLEYDPQGTLVWSYRPDPVTESRSLHHVIVLDGLDPGRLHVDDTTGVLQPVPAHGLPPGLKAVVVTNGAATLSAGDVVMVDRLRSRGFVVTFTSDVAATAAGVAGQESIVISSSAESGPLGTKLRDVAIPVVCIENGAFPTMGLSATTLATDYGSTFNQTLVTIAGGDGAAALLGGLTGAVTGAVTITATPSELGWAQPPASAVIGATMADNPAHAMLFGYVAGSAMVGLAAPARRVGLAIRETAAANLTADGLALFDSAVTFALSN